MLDTLPFLNKITFPAINRKSINILQINLGYRCNQQCLHCHVNAGPNRSEEMSHEVLIQTLEFIKINHIKVVDLTGGAPEMHPDFIYLIKTLRNWAVKVINRCNLTILNEPGYEAIAQSLADNQVEVVASMPCYLEENVNKQRGNGVFESSITALKKLNQLGYGDKGSSLILNLVYNPQGASLSPEQFTLEKDYKQFLAEKYDIIFNQLFTITNVPVKRFGSMLISKNQFTPYMDLLQNAYQPENLEGVMCRYQLSIDWQGYLYDCDFNQMLDLPLEGNGQRLHISNVSSDDLNNKEIIVSGHCYACTAGKGSSCGGALS
ncbi:MAG: arsenosugar biosynthesis radical SAM protein ArsS [gamma proteobacterium symbiont of Bathyaustriella thionipta]|nr:arsenosugar biosynthesis radical SAM protein ArsS [gamma proteobacterium symbiont of Bathyaustriella thionipta]MCU7950933.1 arsenosugar biosynthesis radical SAM protein ArsS [gamma proteobacterium symbiont of Bathyaustriella thionipta]MCU7952744.1 arsenosugar biosynthesis radical SAM protein ArsS [gamma proteobacterium symbiont of Bathyaustriella thionipta]MCU7957424.1 arsenosugar biosynthesis radical SAM protein ArsS [gamma proteobacterium symbiont of Bathyaustriella thionipta]MCU7968696.1 